MKMIIDKVKLRNFKEGTARYERRTEKAKIVPVVKLEEYEKRSCLRKRCERVG